MTSAQLDTMWELCAEPEDREAIMVFLANSSLNEAPPAAMGPSLPDADDSSIGGSHQALTAAYSDEVRIYAFQTLFCSESVHWEHLGRKAYQSFQGLFGNLKKAVRSSLTTNGPALDALWRICLVAGDDHVASQAMKDLLSVYSAMSEGRRQNEVAAQNAWTKKNVVPDMALDLKESFPHKIFDCLNQVKLGLQRGDTLSVRSAERCVRILNAAVGHVESENQTSGVVAPTKIHCINSIIGLVDIIPHGYRGQGCYRTISVVAKRTGTNAQQSTRPHAQNLPQTERFSIQIHPLETLTSLKRKVSICCDHPLDLVKPTSLDNSRRNLNIESESATVGDLGISEGSEIVVLLCSNPFPEHKPTNTKRQTERKSGLKPAEIFGGTGQGPTDEFFNALLDVLEALSLASHKSTATTQVWDLLQSVPSNAGIVESVRSTSQISLLPSNSENGIDKTSMTVDVVRRDDDWSQLLDPNHHPRSVYVLQIIDSFLQPAIEVIQKEENEQVGTLLVQDAASFRQGFIESGGFDAVLRFFTRQKSYESSDSAVFRMENTSVLRILKACFYGRSVASTVMHGEAVTPTNLDNTGTALMQSLQQVDRFLENLTAAVVMDSHIPSVAVMDVLMLIQSTLTSDPAKTPIFASLPHGLSEKLTVNLLLWDSKEVLNSSAVVSSLRIRKTTEEFILQIPILSQFALSWLIKALDDIAIATTTTEEFFSALIRLVTLTNESRTSPSKSQLQMLSDSVCKKLASYIKQVETAAENGYLTTGVLCGCLQLIRTLIESTHGFFLGDGVTTLLKTFQSKPWSQGAGGNIAPVAAIMVDLMGIIFDIFLSDGLSSSSSTIICCDTVSRKLGFDVLNACAKACEQGEGYLALSSRIRSIVCSAAPSLRHRWGQENIGLDDTVAGTMMNTAKYSGLRNQGCTCYMNSVLQQLFMMPELRKSLSTATLPSTLRSTFTASKAQGADLIGKHISLQWDNGTYYDADVLSYNPVTGAHIIRYHPLRMASESNLNEVAATTGMQELPEELVLSEGRPGKETGLFEIVDSSKSQQSGKPEETTAADFKETEDEMAYRRLLEEVQRTFVHLDEGSRGRVFDPRSLVEASGCLKLEFDIWQQNDASEFAMKLLDKLEVPLKKWSPNQFKFLEHTFRLKQTKQKLCKECGLKVRRKCADADHPTIQLFTLFSYYHVFSNRRIEKKT